MYTIALRTPTCMAKKDNNDLGKTFTKRVKTDSKKINKAFEKLNKESEERRAKLGDSLKEFVDNIDKAARKDVEKLKNIFSDDVDVTVDIDDFTEIDDIVVFRDDDKKEE